MAVSRKPLMSFAYFNWTFITRHLRASDPFAPESSSTEDDTHTNTCLVTAIFTPLLEYKLCQTFTTPYLVLTFDSDLASTQDLVLMRGEIIPSVTTKSTTGVYLLSQHDARLLAHGLQRFYSWGSSREREKLLSDFHERTGPHAGEAVEAFRLRGLDGEPYR